MSYVEVFCFYVDALAMDEQVAKIAFPVLVMGLVQDELVTFTPNSDGSDATLALTLEGVAWLAAHERSSDDDEELAAVPLIWV